MKTTRRPAQDIRGWCGSWVMGLLLATACSAATQRGGADHAAGAAGGDDPYLWLEDVNGDKALAWVRERNEEAGKELASGPEFKQLEADLLRIYDSDDRIPDISRHGTYYYNFWKDAQNPRGVWRRTTLDEYRKAQPAWDVVLDVDALGKTEGESWVWQGVDVLKAGGYRHCLLHLSRGGSDAAVTREFDLETRTFVADGFQLPEAKSSTGWIDADTVYVATDFGPGSLTRSGYPRVVKRWQRGTPLSAAETVFEAQESDVGAGAWYDDTEGFERHFVVRSVAFYDTELFQLVPGGTLQKLEVPRDANAAPFREWLLIELRSDWTVEGKTWPAGALLATRLDDYMAGRRELTMLYEPTPNSSLAGYTWTRHHLVLNVLEDVKNRLAVLTPEEGGWKRADFPGAPQFSTVSVGAVDAQESDDYFMYVSDFLTPPSLFYGPVGGMPERLKETPAFFDASGLEVSQHFATSKDDTQVPYFEVSPKWMAFDGAHPTLLTGYGGFEISLLPFYSGAVGRAWLQPGGVYVVANIRGGGEYGPRWHQAALKQNRLRAYEDFAAVAQDLVARQVTSAARLGIQGGSNGGLLMGNMLTRHPQLFGAVVCQVPLLDMKRYTRLPAGASWAAEYGDPDLPEEWAFLQTFSPYQNVKQGAAYPPVFFLTSTRDDRVHPGHARKMMAKMYDWGYDVRYYENIEGGHGAAADNRQRAHMWAMVYSFLWEKLR